MGKETRINIRATQEQKDRLKKACDLTGLNETTLVISCVEAAIHYIEKHGEITLPLAVIPKRELPQTALPRKTA